MVSFCCDACQNVFTKPKVERHLTQSSCKTSSVSCIDCGVVFDAVSVRGHTSCITEEEKFGPKGGDACTQTFCGVCGLRLNGAVHAVQHYDSKKHRAATRRKGTAQGSGAGGTNGGKSNTTDGVGNDVKLSIDDGGVQRRTVGSEGKKAMGNGSNKKVGKIAGLSGVMKKVLRGAKKQRLKKRYLVKGVAELLGTQAPTNLESQVERKIWKSGRFMVRKERVMLSDSAGR